MKHRVHFGYGVVRRLGDVLEALAGRRVFLVAGKSSFELSGAAASLQPAWRRRRVHAFRDFQTNPRLADVRRGLSVLRRHRCDLVLGVGGGSALDLAKLIALCATQRQDPADLLRGGPPAPRRLPLVLVPTTAGSGSEATHFAVVYHRLQKYSVSDPSLLPDDALVDPALTFSCPSRLTAVAGLDALCHAVESSWSVAATSASRAHARAAIRLLLDHLASCVHAPTPRARLALSRAAHLAGRAINVAKTNLAHALSYAMTSRFGVPHGHAAALTLGEVLLFNSRVGEAECVDPRGAAHVRGTIDRLVRGLGCRTASEARERLRGLLQEIGLAACLEELGIHAAAQRARIAGCVNLQRLANNPRAASPLQIRDIVDRAA